MTEVDLTISAARREPSGARLVLTLTLAGMLSGLALAFAHQVTAPRIAANKAERMRGAVLEVVPGATRMQRLALEDDALVPAAGDAAPGEPVLFGAYDDDGAFLGYAIEGAAPGYQDIIRLLYGFDPRRGLVVGMAVLDSRETPGLGDRIYKDDAFVANFSALAAEPPIALVKDGRDAPNEVDAITGATISSGTVVKIINARHAFWASRLPAPGGEPPFLAPEVGPGAGPEDGAAAGEGTP